MISRLYDGDRIAIPGWYDDVTETIDPMRMPTIQVSGITSGYTSHGYKNIIPGSATIKINFRFSAGQDPNAKITQFQQWLKSILPDTVSYTVSTSDPYPAITIDTDYDLYPQVCKILESVYGHAPVARYCGAAVPITGLFQDIL